MSKKKPPFVLISAGGTGGHMSPAAALAADLKSRGFRVELATDTRGQKFASMFDGITIHLVKSGTAGRGVIGKVKGVFNLIVGLTQAFILVAKLRPNLVIGFGGYPSFPAVCVAQKLEIDTILHEQNAVLGKANVLLAHHAERIAFSWPQTTGLEKEDQLRAVITGNPVRADIEALADVDYDPPVEGGDLKIFVMGGSLGATVFSTILPAALAALPEEQRQRLKIVQQCRESDIEDARQIYEDAKINATLATFFDDVANQVNVAHLFIGRSGASTVAEMAIAGLPALYVPYPHHKDQQQKRNADSVAQRGGAWVLAQDEFTIDVVRDKLQSLLQNPQSLSDTAAHAKECGERNAARKLGNLVAAIIAAKQ